MKVPKSNERRPNEILAVVFFKEQSGSEPVRKWLKAFPKKVKKIIGEDIKTVQKGWPLGMPLVRHLGMGLWEVRSTIPDGIARIIFKMIHGEMVLLHGFVKKTQATPKKEIETALDRAKRY